MHIALLEPLNVPETLITQLAEPIVAKGHQFSYYDQKTTDVDELKERSQDADIVMIANNPYPVDVINHAKKLKLINVAFTGVDHVDIASADNQSILVCNAAGYANQAVAELCIGLVLDLYRKISQGNDEIRSTNFPGPWQGAEIKGKTVGIIGTGKIGIMTARLFQAFGAQVIAYDAYENPAAHDMGISYLGLNELLAQADIVSLHVPLLPTTKHLISKKTLASMKSTAVLVNCARGPIVDNEALAEALNTGQIAGAGIDVFDMEPPLPADYALLDAKNVILTPHVGFFTDEAMILRAKTAFDNTLAFLEGKPTNIVTR